MQIGNREALDQTRNDLRDVFDAVWMFAESFGPTQQRAVRCARALDEPNFAHNTGYNWEIHRWGRGCGHNRVIRG